MKLKKFALGCLAINQANQQKGKHNVDKNLSVEICFLFILDN